MFAGCIIITSLITNTAFITNAAASGTSTTVRKTTLRSTTTRPQNTTRPPNTTTTIKPTRAAGAPLTGWGTVDTNEWPAIGQAITLVPHRTPIKVWSSPNTSSPAVTLEARQAVAGDVTFLAVGQVKGWWKVLLPARPNGTVGWVRAPDVDVKVVTDRIVIELSTSRLVYTVGSKVVLDETVATGTGDTPTPTGLFAVKEIVKQNPKGFIGPLALGLTGFSEVLFDYAGGQGSVAIHGTSAPDKLGQRVSHGCVRLSNKAILTLGATASLGTPVEIVQRLSDLPTQRWSPAP
jgi:L,D-transpeptidase catalytic domain